MYDTGSVVDNRAGIANWRFSKDHSFYSTFNGHVLQFIGPRNLNFSGVYNTASVVDNRAGIAKWKSSKATAINRITSE